MTNQTTLKPIHAFAAGSHTTAAGVQVTITADDLKASAQAYNPELHEAPIVVGHPSGTDPAYGWIEGFKVEGKDFLAQPKQVNPDFAELHNSGAFKKRSMSFYHPENKSNPVPGVWYPRHLGFLGAQPPAVKGLRDYAFEESGDFLTVDFDEWTDRIEVGLWRKIKNLLIEKFGAEAADKAIPEWDIDALQEEAVKPAQPDAEDLSSSFEENNKEGEDMPEANKGDDPNQNTDFAERESDLAKREAAFVEREQEAHRATCAEFAEKLVGEGKVLPAQKDGLADFMAALDCQDTIEFSEGDGVAKKTQLGFMKDFLSAMPKVVSFGEHDKGTDKAVDLDDADEIAKAAAEFQESEKRAGRDVSVTTAVAHVQKQNGGNTHE